MNIKEFVADELVYKLMTETLRHIDTNLNELSGSLAVQIIEEKDEDKKQLLIKEYELVKKFNKCQYEDIDFDDYESNIIYEIKKALKERIHCMVGTIIPAPKK